MRDLDTLDAQRKRQQREQRMALESLEADVREAFALPAVRRLVKRFWIECGEDGTAFDTNGLLMAHKTGRLEAAGWWRNLIRQLCPEMERKTRSERLILESNPTSED